MQIVIDGILTHYEILGNKPKTLLILHGWRRSLTEWLPISKQLSNRYQVVLLDLPGFGQTSRPETAFSIYDYAAFVTHFLDKLELENVTLLGHSFGGRIGIVLAAETKKMEKLVLVDSAGIEKRSIAAKIKIRFFTLAKLFLPRPFIEKLRYHLGSPDYRTAGAMRKTFVKVINEDLTYLLPKISIPTFLIWGEKDTEVALWKTRLMKELIPHSHLRVIWGAGHSPYLEKPREFMEILDEFLRIQV